MTAEDWPLSAVQTELLLGRLVARGRALSLTLKELVVSGAWTLAGRDVPGRLWGTRRVPVLARGAAPVPDRLPLPALHARLHRLAPAPVELRTVVPGLQAETGLPSLLLEQARADLVARRLLRPEKRLLRTVLVRTPAGDAWCGGLAVRRDQWRRALQAGGAQADAALAEMGRAPGLVPLLDARALRDVDRAVRTSTAGEVWGGAGVPWSDLCDVDGGGGLGGLDGAFDAVDSGSGFDSGGGDSGGGDGGGGGD